MRFVILIFLASLAAHAGLTDDSLRDIDFTQKVSGQVSMGLTFTDERGRLVTLADCAGGRPVILALGYYRCPMLCTLELNGLVSSLQDLKPAAANAASVIFISVDPSENPALAAAKKASYVKLYARKESASQWHFLTGTSNSIALLADQVGFRYAYDSASRQFAHPSGLIILQPDGKISRYFLGISYESGDLARALRDAAAQRPGGFAQQFVYLCFHYTPIRGKYGGAIMNTVRVGGAFTLAVLGGMIWLARPRRGKEALCHTG